MSDLTPEDIEAIMRESKWLRDVQRELQVKLSKKQKQKLKHFRRGVKTFHDREPYIEEYKMALDVIGEYQKIRLPKKNIYMSRRERLRAIITLRYRVPERVMAAYDEEVDEYRKWCWDD